MNKGAHALQPPREVIEIASRLETAGFETWCVGGAIRDSLLGHPHLDWDLATAATPQDVRRLFPRTVPVGIEFGTVGVLDGGGTLHEVTTFRRDIETDGRHAVVQFGATIDEDLARRDFTINAIAFSASRGRLHDPFGGRADLERRVIRAVGDPRERMREDRLRALRGIRFAARFDFDIDPATWSAIQGSAPHLTRLSPERVKQELEKTMEQVRHPSRALSLWEESGALAVLIPALAPLSPVTLRSLDALPPAVGRRADARRLDRLTALFAQLAPPEVERSLRALRFSNSQIAWVRAIVERWQMIAEEVERSFAADAAASDGDVRRWVAAAGRTRVAAVFRLARARLAGRNALDMPAPAARGVASLYRRAVRSAFRDAVELSDLALDGTDLHEAGVPDGPEMGWMLRRLLEAVVDDPSLNTRDRLLALARDLHREYLEKPEEEL